VKRILSGRVSGRVSIIRQVWRALRILLHIIYGVLLAGTLRVVRFTSPKRYSNIRAKWARHWLSAAIEVLGIRLSVEGRAPTGTSLFAANHISWVDVLALAAVVEADFIAKQEVRRWPLLGWLVSRGGTLFVRRTQPNACKRVIEESAFRLKSGRSIVLFPEGTTTTGDQVLPFKPLLLRAAVLAQVPVQPVALRYEVAGECRERVAFVGEMGFLTHLWKVLGLRGVCLHIGFCTPLSANAGHERQLAEAACRTVAGKLGVLLEPKRVTAA
jgi:1-acyl-sn-glycerol-3-phosphate acyltransferase